MSKKQKKLKIEDLKKGMVLRFNAGFIENNDKYSTVRTYRETVTKVARNKQHYWTKPNMKTPDWWIEGRNDLDCLNAMEIDPEWLIKNEFNKQLLDIINE